jgi:hypothetical protein
MWEGDLDDRMVPLREHLVDRTSLADRTRSIPPYFRIVKQLKKPVDEWQSLCVVPDQERPRDLQEIESRQSKLVDEIRTHAHAEIARRWESGSGELAISSSQNVVKVVLRKVSRPWHADKQGCGLLMITVRHLLSVC